MPTHLVIIQVGRIAELATVKLLLHHLVVVFVVSLLVLAHKLLRLALLELALVHAERRVAVQVGCGLILRAQLNVRLVTDSLAVAHHRRVFRGKVARHGTVLRSACRSGQCSLGAAELRDDLGEVVERAEDRVDQDVDVRVVEIDVGERVREDDGKVLLEHELGELHRRLRVRPVDVREGTRRQQAMAEVGEAGEPCVTGLGWLGRCHRIAERSSDDFEDGLAHDRDLVRRLPVCGVAEGRRRSRIVTKTNDDERRPTPHRRCALRIEVAKWRERRGQGEIVQEEVEERRARLGCDRFLAPALAGREGEEARLARVIGRDEFGETREGEGGLVEIVERGVRRDVGIHRILLRCVRRRVAGRFGALRRTRDRREGTLTRVERLLHEQVNDHINRLRRGRQRRPAGGFGRCVAHGGVRRVGAILVERRLEGLRVDLLAGVRAVVSLQRNVVVVRGIGANELDGGLGGFEESRDVTQGNAVCCANEARGVGHLLW